jgi:hypothetical protein
VSQIQKVTAQLELNKFATGPIRRGGPHRKQSSRIAKTGQTKLAATAVTLPWIRAGEQFSLPMRIPRRSGALIVRADENYPLLWNSNLRYALAAEPLLT